MKPYSTMTRSAGTNAVAAAAFCCLFGLLFTKTAKADCGPSRIPRAVANFADYEVGSNATPQLEGGSNHPHQRSQEPQPSSAEPNKAAVDPSLGGGSIVGLWLTTFISPGVGVVDQGFDIWSSDGTEILNDYPPPSSGSVCLGTYIQTGPNTFVLKHPSWVFDPTGQTLVGTAIIRETVTVQSSGNTFKGTFTLSSYDLSGKPDPSISPCGQPSCPGTLTGTRITVN